MSLKAYASEPNGTQFIKFNRFNWFHTTFFPHLERHNPWSPEHICISEGKPQGLHEAASSAPAPPLSLRWFAWLHVLAPKQNETKKQTLKHVFITPFTTKLLEKQSQAHCLPSTCPPATHSLAHCTAGLPPARLSNGSQKVSNHLWLPNPIPSSLCLFFDPVDQFFTLEPLFPWFL